MSDAAQVAVIASVPASLSKYRRHQKAQCCVCGKSEWRTVRDGPAGQLPKFTHKGCNTRLRTPFIAALEEAKTTFGGVDKAIRALAERGIKIAWGTWFQWMQGALPKERERIVGALADGLEYPPAEAQVLLDSLQSAVGDRRTSFAAARAAQTKWIECAGLCGRRALRRLVRKQKAFERTGRWSCRVCHKLGDSSKVPIICNVPNCRDVRWDYGTKRVEALPTRHLHADRFVPKPNSPLLIRLSAGSLVRVRPCQRHHLARAGRRGRPKAREALFRGRSTSKAGNTGPNKLMGFQTWYRRQTSLLDSNKEPLTAREVWDLRWLDLAGAVDAKTLARAKEVVASYFAQRLPGARTARRSSHQAAPRRRRGQGVQGLGAKSIQAAAASIRRCALCWTVVGARNQANRSWFHQGCFNVWAGSRDYAETSGRARTCHCGRVNPATTKACPACGTPLLPPMPPWLGDPTTDDGLRQKFTWFIRHVVRGEPINVLAIDYVRERWPSLRTGLAKKAEHYRGNVLKGIRDFARWLPSDLTLAIRKAATRQAIERRLAQLRTQSAPKRRRQDLARIGWLGLRFGMAPAAIGYRVVGFDAREILRLLQSVAAVTPPSGLDPSDVERVRKGAHLADGVALLVPREIGIARERKRRLTSEELQAILTEPTGPGVNVYLAKKYGVSSTHISTIRNKRSRSSRQAQNRNMAVETACRG
jgi:hypothetical protein